jgi:uncharacterized protein (DUF1015 family)
MVASRGLVGLRPAPEQVAIVTCPPYDVIKPGSPLEDHLRDRPGSMFHVILGDAPATTLEWLRTEGFLIEDDEPAFYVYEQSFEGEARTGVFLAAEVTPYEARQVIRHEKVFDEKVRGRVALARSTGHTFGPVFVLTRATLAPILTDAKAGPPLYEFTSDFGGISALHGIANRVWRVPDASPLGRRISGALSMHPFYIADGHHRYHAALRNQQSHFLCYVTEEARIQAYNRVVTGPAKFAEIRDELSLSAVSRFQTPPKHTFCLHTRDGTWLLAANHVPNDVVGRLDCAILERELYPKLGLTHEMIQDREHFDYYPESALDEMMAAVARGDYDLAIALHPVSLDELIAVADAGLEDPDVVMPEKSTYFAPKILTGLFSYRHEPG